MPADYGVPSRYLDNFPLTLMGMQHWNWKVLYGGKDQSCRFFDSPRTSLFYQTVLLPRPSKLNRPLGLEPQHSHQTLNPVPHPRLHLHLPWYLGCLVVCRTKRTVKHSQSARPMPHLVAICRTAQSRLTGIVSPLNCGTTGASAEARQGILSNLTLAPRHRSAGLFLYNKHNIYVRLAS